MPARATVVCSRVEGGADHAHLELPGLEKKAIEESFLL